MQNFGSSLLAGQAVVRIVAENTFAPVVKAITADLRKLSRDVTRFGANLQNIGLGATAFGASIATGFGFAIKAASTATETTAAFEGVFRDLAPAAEESVQRISVAFRRAETDVRKFQIGFFSFLRGAGFTTQDSQGLTNFLTQGAFDFASRFEVPDNEAFERFLSGLAGSSEVFARFGVAIRRANLERAFADLGINETVETATEFQKIAARIRILQKTLGKDIQNVLGDVTRTQDEFANQLKSVQAALKKALEEIGLPVTQALAPLLGSLRGVIAGFSLVASRNPELTQALAAIVTSVTGAGAALFGLGVAMRLLPPLFALTIDPLRRFVELLIRIPDIVLFPVAAGASALISAVSTVSKSLSGFVGFVRNLPQTSVNLFSRIVLPQTGPLFPKLDTAIKNAQKRFEPFRRNFKRFAESISLTARSIRDVAVSPEVGRTVLLLRSQVSRLIGPLSSAFSGVTRLLGFTNPQSRRAVISLGRAIADISKVSFSSFGRFLVSLTSLTKGALSSGRSLSATADLIRRSFAAELALSVRSARGSLAALGLSFAAGFPRANAFARSVIGFSQSVLSSIRTLRISSSGLRNAVTTIGLAFTANFPAVAPFVSGINLIARSTFAAVRNLRVSAAGLSIAASQIGLSFRTAFPRTSAVVDAFSLTVRNQLSLARRAVFSFGFFAAGSLEPVGRSFTAISREVRVAMGAISSELRKASVTLGADIAQLSANVFSRFGNGPRLAFRAVDTLVRGTSSVFREVSRELGVTANPIVVAFRKAFPAATARVSLFRNNLASQLNNVRSIFRVFSRAASTILGPVGLAFRGISTQVRSALSSISTELSRAAIRLGSEVANFSVTIFRNFRQGPRIAASALQGLLSGVSSVFGRVSSELGVAVKELSGTFSRGLARAYSGVLSAGRRFAGSYSRTFAPLRSSLEGISNSVRSGLRNAFAPFRSFTRSAQQSLESVRQTFASLGFAINRSVRSIVRSLTNFVSALNGPALTAVRLFGRQFSAAFAGIVFRLTPLAKNVRSVLGEIGRELASASSYLGAEALRLSRSIFSRFNQGRSSVRRTFSNIFTDTRGQLVRIGAQVGSGLRSVTSRLPRSFSSAFRSVRNQARSFSNQSRAIFLPLASSARAAASRVRTIAPAFGTIVGVANAAVRSAVSVMGNSFIALGSVALNVGSSILSAFTRVKDILLSISGETLSSVRDAFLGLFGVLKSILGIVGRLVFNPFVLWTLGIGASIRLLIVFRKEIGDLLSSISTRISRFASVVSGGISEAFNPGRSLVNLGRDILGIAGTVGGSFIDSLNKGASALEGFLGVDSGGFLGSAVFQSFTESLRDNASVLRKSLTEGRSLIDDFFSSTESSSRRLGSTIRGVFSGVVSGISRSFRFLLGFAERIRGVFITSFRTIAAAASQGQFRSAFDVIAATLRVTFNELVSDFIAEFGAGISAVGQGASSLFLSIAPVFTTIGVKLIDAFETAGKILLGFGNGFLGIFDKVLDVVSAIIQGVRGSFNFVQQASRAAERANPIRPAGLQVEIDEIRLRDRESRLEDASFGFKFIRDATPEERRQLKDREEFATQRFFDARFAREDAAAAQRIRRTLSSTAKAVADSSKDLLGFNREALSPDLIPVFDQLEALAESGRGNLQSLQETIKNLNSNQEATQDVIKDAIDSSLNNVREQANAASSAARQELIGLRLTVDRGEVGSLLFDAIDTSSAINLQDLTPEVQAQLDLIASSLDFKDIGGLNEAIEKGILSFDDLLAKALEVEEQIAVRTNTGSFLNRIGTDQNFDFEGFRPPPTLRRELNDIGKQINADFETDNFKQLSDLLRKTTPQALVSAAKELGVTLSKFSPAIRGLENSTDLSGLREEGSEQSPGGFGDRSLRAIDVLTNEGNQLIVDAVNRRSKPVEIIAQDVRTIRTTIERLGQNFTQNIEDALTINVRSI